MILKKRSYSRLDYGNSTIINISKIIIKKLGEILENPKLMELERKIDEILEKT